MKGFEIVYLGLEPFLPPLWKRVRSELAALAQSRGGSPLILDAGGRKSHYTIGVPARIAVADLPRRSELQETLYLGATAEMARQLKERRSNVGWVLFDDMTRSSLKGGTFDCVVAVEVLEHVEQDAEFLREACRVLKPGGVFLMTTPNGDFVPNHNPDHKRHYTRGQLLALLERHFEEAEVEYAIAGGRFRSWGLRSWSARRPVRTAMSMAANVVNSWQSARSGLKHEPHGTRHLIARARKGL